MKLTGAIILHIQRTRPILNIQRPLILLITMRGADTERRKENPGTVDFVKLFVAQTAAANVWEGI